MNSSVNSGIQPASSDLAAPTVAPQYGVSQPISIDQATEAELKLTEQVCDCLYTMFIGLFCLLFPAS